MLGAVLVGIGATAGGCGSAAIAPPACVSAPAGGTAIPSGARVRVDVGAIVVVALVEPDRYTAASPAFPWLPATSSDPRVLSRAPVCSRPGTATLPLRLAVFRAVSPGTALVVAPLAPAWRRQPAGSRRGLAAYRSTVVVSG